MIEVFAHPLHATAALVGKGLARGAPVLDAVTALVLPYASDPKALVRVRVELTARRACVEVDPVEPETLVVYSAGPATAS